MDFEHPYEKEFWRELQRTAEMVLEEGRKNGFGSAIIEIKYADGRPVVALRSSSQSRKYTKDQDAQTDVQDELQRSKVVGFTGVRTFSTLMSNGIITQVILDDFEQHNL